MKPEACVLLNTWSTRLLNLWWVMMTYVFCGLNKHRALLSLARIGGCLGNYSRFFASGLHYVDSFSTILSLKIGCFIVIMCDQLITARDIPSFCNVCPKVTVFCFLFSLIVEILFYLSVISNDLIPFRSTVHRHSSCGPHWSGTYGVLYIEPCLGLVISISWIVCFHFVNVHLWNILPPLLRLVFIFLYLHQPTVSSKVLCFYFSRCPFILSDRSCCHNILWTTWAVSVKLYLQGIFTSNYWWPNYILQVKGHRHSRPSTCRKQSTLTPVRPFSICSSDVSRIYGIVYSYFMRTFIC